MAVVIFPNASVENTNHTAHHVMLLVWSAPDISSHPFTGQNRGAHISSSRLKTLCNALHNT